MKPETLRKAARAYDGDPVAAACSQAADEIDRLQSELDKVTANRDEWNTLYKEVSNQCAELEKERDEYLSRLDKIHQSLFRFFEVSW